MKKLCQHPIISWLALFFVQLLKEPQRGRHQIEEADVKPLSFVIAPDSSAKQRTERRVLAYRSVRIEMSSLNRHVVRCALSRGAPALIVDLRCRDVPMAEQFLNFPDVHARV